MKLETIEKSWGVEFKMSTHNTVITENLGKTECEELVQDMIECQKDMCSYSEINKVNHIKSVIEHFYIYSSDIEELIEYLQSKV